MYIYIYIRHTLIAWARFVWSCPQTGTGPTRRRSKDRVRARAETEQGPHGTGGNRRRSMCEKDRLRAEMEQKQSKRDCARERRRKQRDTASEESKAKEKEPDRYSHDTMLTLLKLFRRPLCHLHRSISSPAPSTYTLHVVTTDIYLHISGYSSAQGILCACVFLV